jgi:superkiller protein 3
MMMRRLLNPRFVLAALCLAVLPACIEEARNSIPFLPPSKFVEIGGRKLTRTEVAYYKKIKDLSYATKINPRDAVAYNAIGELFQKKGNYSLAKELYLKAIDIDATLSEPHHNLGQIYLYEDRFNGAVDELQKARKLSPDDARIRHRLGMAKAGLAKPQEALKEYDEAIALDPEYTPAYLEKGKLLYSLHRYAEATATCRAALAKAPKIEVSTVAKEVRGPGLLDKVLPTGQEEEAPKTYRQEAAFDLALCLKAQGQFREALAVLVQSENAPVAQSDVQMLKARLLDATGDSAGAITTLQTLRTAFPNMAEIPKRLAKLYQKTNQLDLASKTRLEAAELDHSDRELQEEAARYAEQKKDSARAIAIYERLVRVDPDNMKYRRLLAKAFDQTGILRSAALAYQEIVNRDGDDMATRRRLGILYAELPGFAGRAQLQFKVVLEKNPQDAEVHRKLGELLLSSPTTYGEAELHIQASLRANPNDAQAYQNLATLQGGQQRFEDAVTNYRKALQLDPKLSVAQINLAKVLLTLKRNEEALVPLKAYLAAHADDEDAHRLLAEDYRDLGRKEDAVKEYEAIDALKPAEVQSKMELATLQTGMGKQRAAVGLYESILEKHPADLNALREAGRLYGEMKMTLRSIYCWQRVMALKPGDLEAQSKLASQYLAIGDEDAALARYEAVGKSGDAEAWKSAAQLRLKRKERDAAIDALKEALKIKNTDPEARRSLAALLMNSQSPEEKDEALRLCKELTELNPKDYRAHLNLANLYSEFNRLSEAQDEYETILHDEPGNAAANLGVGVVWRKRGQYQKAIDCYTKALETDPKSAVIHYNIALTYDFYLKDAAKAKEQYALYVQCGGDRKKVPDLTAPGDVPQRAAGR